MRSVNSVLAVSTNLSAKQFALGQLGGIFTALIPASARTVSKGREELTSPVADEEPELGSAIAEVH
jgi:hypothetical protein